MKTIELLNKVVKLGFDREKALADIDTSLDEIIGAENRKTLMSLMNGGEYDGN